MRGALFVLGFVCAVLLLSAPAGAASPKAVFEKRGLFGTWAIDCTKPASAGNPHAVYRPLPNGMQRETYTAPGRPFDVSFPESIVESAPDELIIAWNTGEGRITNRIRLQPDQMRIMDSTRQSGEKLSVDGRRVRGNAENPWFKRCGVLVSSVGWVRAEGP
jgi:hypothetical protein